LSGDRYKIENQNGVYFLNFTVIDWIDLFTRKEFCIVLIDSLNYCIKEKNLEVFAYVFMSSHVQVICKVNEGLFKNFKPAIYNSLDIGPLLND